MGKGLFHSCFSVKAAGPGSAEAGWAMLQACMVQDGKPGQVHITSGMEAGKDCVKG